MSNTAIPFFLYPFATVGDVPSSVPPIPNTGSDSDPVNYQNGWTVPYEYPTTNPSYLPVPRTSFNQVLLDITSALQQYQWQGTPLFVLPVNGGPNGYLKYSYVIYDAGAGVQVWESQVGTTGSPNTSVPGADVNWLLVSGNAQGIQPGTINDFAGFIPPSNALLCDGTDYARATYVNLFNAICPVLSCTTVSSSAVITVPSSQGMFPGMIIESANFTGAAVITLIGSSTSITVNKTANTSSTVNVRFFSWGNGDGSTTFNVPNLNGRVTAGSDFGGTGLPPESGTLNNTCPGQITGAAARQIVATNLPTHTHTSSATSAITGITKDKTGSSSTYMITGNQGDQHAFSSGLPNVTVTTSVTVGNNTTTNAAFDIVQPTAIVCKIIHI